VDGLTQNGHHLAVRVLKKADYWVALSINAPGSASGDTLPELFAEVEFHKHFCLGLSKDEPVRVEYVAGQPEICEEVRTAYAAFLSLPPDKRPQAVTWDHDNDRPANPAHTGPYLNL